MIQPTGMIERRTSADVVFDHLFDEIISLGLLPGTKMSEVEVANQFGVSRQPVRDAFSRLGSMDLLLIRPQKATVVRKFSRTNILNARFVRTAIEIEVLRKACSGRDKKCDARIKKNLSQQKQATDKQDADKFHALDYEFHQLLCLAAGSEFAFQAIADNKAQVDRLCMLSLTDSDSMEALYQDHLRIFEALVAADEEALVEVIRQHLGRLDETIDSVRQSHPDYFED